jgi:hypothetical protein
MTLALDGTPNGHASTTGNKDITLTTSNSNDVIIMIIDTETASPGVYRTVTGISGGGLTWQKRSSQQWNGSTSRSRRREIWWAVAPSPLSAVTFTATLSGLVDTYATLGFAVSGANTSAPWDTNGSLPAQVVDQTGSSTTPTVTGVSTSDPVASFIFAVWSNSNFNNPSPLAPGTGYTGLLGEFTGAGSYDTSVETEYKVGTASSATVTFARSVPNWGMTVDALQSAVVSSTGTLAVTEAVDTFAGTAVLPHSGTLAVTEAVDTFAGTGYKGHNAAWASTEAVDTFAGTGYKGHNAAWSSSEAVDVFSGAGDLQDRGVWASTEDPDVFDATGTLTSFTGVIGGIAALEAPDVFAAAGSAVIIATMLVTEDADQFHAFGKLTIVGTFGPTEAKDVFSATGTVLGATGIWHSNEPVDTMSITGKVPRVGTWASTEHSDTAIFTGLGSTGTTARRIFFVT